MAAYIVHCSDSLLFTAVGAVSFYPVKQLTYRSRAYTYKQLKYHYFLFDMCYYATILNLAFLWLFSSSEAVFVAAYCMTMGEYIISGCLVSQPTKARSHSLLSRGETVLSSIVSTRQRRYSYTCTRHWYSTRLSSTTQTQLIAFQPWKVSTSCNLVWRFYTLQ